MAITFYAASCFAQDRSAQTIEALSLSSKIKRPEILLSDFVDGKSTTRVIINLSKPVTFDRSRSFKSDESRKKVRETVNTVQNRVISRMDSGSLQITNRFSYNFGISAEVTLKGLQELLEMDDVFLIEKDEILKSHMAQGIPLIVASSVRETYDGSGVAIAICDTGIDYSHPMLGGGGFPNNKVIGGRDTGDNDNDPMDLYGHGTCCAGIAAGNIGTTGDYIGGVAPNAKLYALKVTQGSGDSAYYSDMLEAWEWCITHQSDDPSHPIMVISTSLGSGRYFSICDGVYFAMTDAVANLTSAGISLFVSSGNDGYCDAISFPACISDVISVGAVYDASFGTYYPCVAPTSCAEKRTTHQCDTGYYAEDATSADIVPSYSNTGALLDLLAPSDQAHTTDLTGTAGYSPNNYESAFGGTSAASPYAAGAAACLQAAAKSVTGAFLTPQEVRSKLIGTGDLVTDDKANMAIPRVNLEAAVTLVDVPVIHVSNLVPNHGGYGTKISVNGTGFGDNQWGMIDGADGYHSVITFSGGPGDLVATKYPLWSETKTNTKIKALFVDSNGNDLLDGDETLLSAEDLPLGPYALTIRTVWFHDGNGNSTYDPGEEVYESFSSVSNVFTLTDEPVIYRFRPDNTAEPAMAVKIKGINFGDFQADSVVHVGPKTFDATSAKIKLWSDIKIKIKIPNYKCDWFDGQPYKYRKVWVTVDGADSNKKKLKVLKPGTCP